MALWFVFGLITGIALVFGGISLLTHLAKRAMRKMREKRREGGFPPPKVPEGDTALYAWRVRTLDGDVVPMDRMIRETLFLNFWSTQCPPCVQELASIERLHAQLAPEGVVFMCVASDSDLAQLRAWIAEQKVRVPVFALMDNDLPAVFDSDFVPATYIIDSDSRVAFKQEGAARWDHPRVLSFLRALHMQGVLGLGREMEMEKRTEPA